MTRFSFQIASDLAAKNLGDELLVEKPTGTFRKERKRQLAVVQIRPLKMEALVEEGEHLPQSGIGQPPRADSLADLLNGVSGKTNDLRLSVN